MSFTERLIARQEPWLGSEKGPSGLTDYEILLTAIATMFLPLLEVAEEEGEDGTAGYVPAYGRLLDPNTCPAKDLPYLGQFVGIEVPTGASESEARALVKGEAGLARGTFATMETTVKGIAGTGARVLERTGPSGEANVAYHFLVYVPTGKATQELYNAINAVKPAGLMYTVTEVTNTWLNGVKKHWSEITVTKWAEMVEPNY